MLFTDMLCQQNIPILHHYSGIRIWYQYIGLVLSYINVRFLWNSDIHIFDIFPAWTYSYHMLSIIPDCIHIIAEEKQIYPSFVVSVQISLEDGRSSNLK